MNVDNRKWNSAVVLDIKKAFDTADHKILLQKLSCHRIKDNSQKLTESCLQGGIQCCSVNGHVSAMEQTHHVWSTPGVNNWAFIVHNLYE